MANASPPSGRFELRDEDVGSSTETLRAGRIEQKLTLRHKPTGIEIVGKLPPEAYTKAQLNAATEALRATLMEQLRTAVMEQVKRTRLIQPRHGVAKD